MHHLEYCAPEVQTFWPVTTHSSPSLTARVFRPARSEPASGSLKPWHQISSALRIVGRWLSFWRSSPQTISVGPASSRPSVLTGSGAPERPSSSKKIAVSISDAPRPPYSLGQCTPAPPPAVLRGPMPAGPAAVVEAALPVGAPAQRLVLVGRLVAGRVGGEPVA